MKKVKKLGNLIFYGGANKLFYLQRRNELRDINLKYLMCISCLSVFAGIALCISSNFVEVVQNMSRVYLEFLFRSVILTVITFTICRKYRGAIYPVFYTLLFTLYYLGIIIGTYINPEHNATTFCVLLVALPLVIVDKTWRINLFLTAVTFVYICCVNNFETGWVASMDIYNGIVFLFVGYIANIFITITKVKEISGRVSTERDRDTDALSGLLNRRAAELSIERFLASNTSSRCALMIIDIDKFKEVNDTLGHQWGDKVINECAQIIKGFFRSSDIVGRLGGDEFIIFITDIPRNDWLFNKATTIIKSGNRSISNGKETCPVSFSMGIAVSPDDAVTYDELYTCADEALYYSKRSGRGRYTKYKKDLPK